MCLVSKTRSPSTQPTPSKPQALATRSPTTLDRRKSGIPVSITSFNDADPSDGEQSVEPDEANDDNHGAQRIRRQPTAIACTQPAAEQRPDRDEAGDGPVDSMEGHHRI